MDEPTVRNSNLLPVKANGDVRLRSVASFFMYGMECTPVKSFPPWMVFSIVPFATSCVRISSSCSPKNMEIITGGASFPPSLWSFPGFEAERRKSSACSSTALITAARKNKNCVFSCGFLPGFKRFLPVFVIIAQLSCFPEPFTPAKGFSCSRHASPWRFATFFMHSIISWLWSVAMFAVA